MPVIDPSASTVGDLRHDEAIDLANDSPFGLGGAVFHTDTAVALDVARRGARVILACRSGLADAVLEVKRASDAATVARYLRFLDFAQVIFRDDYTGLLRFVMRRAG